MFLVVQKVVGYALSGPEGVVVAFGNSGLDTWSTDAAGLLRKLGDEKEPGVKIYHVRYC